MAYDPNLPANNSPIVSAELRAQFAGLKALIDAQQAQITALQFALLGKAIMPQLSEFDPSIDDPPTTANLQEFKGYISSMAQQLMGVQW